MAEANALAIVPDGIGATPGEMVDVLLFDVDHVPPVDP
jgi:hypothetical protein